MKFKSLEEWGLNVPLHPLVIAGPCSAETQEQVMEIARGLLNCGVGIMRAGIWKPRTRPGCFEGVGEEGLDWLKAAREQTGLKMAIEVACTKHVEQALAAGIDILWVGARTTSNPFAVQEIADALAGVDIPIFVKNPVSPDISLWLGAMERIANSGITRLGAIHRGFTSNSSKSLLRNEPQWQLVVELRRQAEGIPILCDPSHITGRRDLIATISQKAIDLDFHGLIIETHNNPEKAWSDASQQVTPETLQVILEHLTIRASNSEDAAFQREIQELRAVLDQVDSDIVELLHRRMQACERIGQLKRDNNVTVLQASRWDHTVRSLHSKASLLGLSHEFTDKIFRAIHQESINIQEAILNPEVANKLTEEE